MNLSLSVDAMATKRVSLTLDIVRRIEAGGKNAEICKEFHLSSSTVSMIWKDKEDYGT